MRVSLITDPETRRIRPVTLSSLVTVLGVTLTVGALVGLFFSLKAFFVYLAATGMAAVGCWGITILVAFVALSIFARLVLLFTGGPN